MRMCVALTGSAQVVYVAGEWKVNRGGDLKVDMCCLGSNMSPPNALCSSPPSALLLASGAARRAARCRLAALTC